MNTKYEKDVKIGKLEKSKTVKDKGDVREPLLINMNSQYIQSAENSAGSLQNTKIEIENNSKSPSILVPERITSPVNKTGAPLEFTFSTS